MAKQELVDVCPKLFDTPGTFPALKAFALG
jgi:hypothetical protein